MRRGIARVAESIVEQAALGSADNGVCDHR